VSFNIRASSYRWNTRGCYKFSGRTPRCFAHSQTKDTVTGFDLTARDSGTVSCTATVNNVEYTSDPLTIRISGNIIMLKYYCLEPNRHSQNGL